MTHIKFVGRGQRLVSELKIKELIWENLRSGNVEEQ